MLDFCVTLHLKITKTERQTDMHIQINPYSIYHKTISSNFNTHIPDLMDGFDFFFQL